MRKKVYSGGYNHKKAINEQDSIKLDAQILHDQLFKLWLSKHNYEDIAIIMLKVYGYNQTDIAGILKISQKTVCNHLVRLKVSYDKGFNC